MTYQRIERLDRTAASRKTTIAGALANYESALQAARSLWLASERVHRAEFSAFARSLDLSDRYPGLQGIGWRSVVTHRQLRSFLARTRADGEPGFTIRPPGRRPVYYVAEYSYPRIPSSTALGADARANPGVVATLDEARDSGQTTVSHQTTLPGDLNLPSSERPVAFELFVPVYRIEVQPEATPAERRRQFLGWATGQFRAGDFLKEAMKTAPAGNGVELHDTEAGDQSLVASYPEGFRASGPYVRDGTFVYGGREFTLRFAPLPGNPTDPLRRWGVRGPAARLHARRRHGDRRAPPDRPVRGHLLDRVADWDRREDVGHLVARADRALYAAKAAGRDRCRADPAPAASPAAASRVP